MKTMRNAVAAVVLTLGLVGYANAHVVFGIGVGLPGPVYVPPPVAVMPAPVYPVPAYYPPPAPVYAAPVYAPPVAVGYVGPGWYGHPYHPWHYGYGYGYWRR